MKGSLINKSEVERINVKLEILAHSLWQEISEQEKLKEQLGSEFNETVRPIQELESVITHWRLINICISIVTISLY